MLTEPAPYPSSCYGVADQLPHSVVLSILEMLGDEKIRLPIAPR